MRLSTAAHSIIGAAMVLLTVTAARARGPRGLGDEANPNPVTATLSSIDIANGQVKELLHLDHQSLGVPVVVGDVVYVSSSGKTLFALDRHTGEKKWTYTSEHVLFGIVATPKALFVCAGSDELALDAGTGKVIWAFNGDIAMADPVLIDGAVICNSFDGPVAIEQETGKLRWKLDVQWGSFVFSPLSDRRLCIWKTDEIYVVDTERGKTLWQSAADIHATAPGAFPSPAVGDRDLICQLRGAPKDARDWSLHALDAGSGHGLWKTNLGDHGGAGGRTLMAADTVYCVLDENVYALSLKTGDKRWEAAIKPAEANGALMVAIDGSLCIPQAGGEVLALDGKTGEKKWLNVPATPAAPEHFFRASGMTCATGRLYLARNELSEP